MNRPVSTVLAVLFALVIAAPAWAQRDRGPRETETIDRTLSLPANGTVRLKTFSGRVRITGGSSNQVVVKAVRRATRDRLNDIKLEITRSGNTIEIDANHRVVERRNDNVVETDFEIQVPASARLDIKTFSGRFESDLPVTLNSSSRRNFRGQLNGGGAGDFRLKTFSGDVTIRR